MKLDPPTTQRMEEYLQAVAQRLQDRPAAERQDTVEALRRHIREGLQQLGHDPALADLEQVLAGMDAPEEYGAPAPAAPPRGHGVNKWFLLALGFLLVNAWGVWKMKPRPLLPPAWTQEIWFSAAGQTVTTNEGLQWAFSAPMASTSQVGRAFEDGPILFQPEVPGQFIWISPTLLEFYPRQEWPPCQRIKASLREGLACQDGKPWTAPFQADFQTEPLQLRAVEQADVSPERQVTLRLKFNAAPDPRALPKYLELLDGDERLDYSLSGSAHSNVVLIQTAALEGEVIAYSCSAGLPALNGPLGLAATVQNKLPINDRMEYRRLNAESPAFESCFVDIYFTRAPEMATLSSFVEIQPAVRYQASPLDHWWEGVGCTLRGDFQPGKTYTIKLKTGLRAESGEVLKQELVRTVQFPDRPRSLAFAAPGRYLAPEGQLLVPALAMNVREVELRCAPVLPANLVQMVMRESGRYPCYYGDGIWEDTGNLTAQPRVMTNQLPARLNLDNRFFIPLKQLAGQDQPRGVFLISLSAEKTGSAHQLMVITDLGISARQAGAGFLVWVNSLRAAQPVAGARVTLYGQNGASLAQGATDTQGLVFLACDPNPEREDGPLLITAENGADLSFISLADDALAVAGGEGQRPLPADGAEAFLFTDRGIYRPGETLHLKALVRDRLLQTPTAFPALFRILRPDGRLFKEVPVQLDDLGAAETSAVLPDYLPTGRYLLLLALPGTLKELGQTEIMLEDFVPPQIRVSAHLQPKAARAGEPLELSVQAEHLFGRPAAGLPVSGRIIYEPADFAPKAWPEYVFGDEERSFSRVTRELGHGLLDEAGHDVFEHTANAAWRPPAMLRAVGAVTVMEASGRAVSAYASANVHCYPYYLGLKLAGGRRLVQAGEDLPLQVVCLAPDESLWTETPALQLNIARAEWTSVLRRKPDGRYAFESERVLTPVQEDVIAISDAQSTYRLQFKDAGDYLVTLKDPRHEVSASVLVSASPRGQEWVSWNRENPDRVELALDKPAYAPGETARLLIKSPFDGLALLTVEARAIREQRLIKLEKNTAEAQILVEETDIPNAYCAVTVLRPAQVESVWSAHRASGQIALNVRPANRKLVLAVDAPATNRPCTALPVRIQLQDESGHPTQGEVTLMAVDEAICMLTDFPLPDPYAYFMETRYPFVNAYDLYSHLMPLTDEKAAGLTRVGGDEGEARRRLNPIKSNRFKPVALWLGARQTDSNGVVQGVFDVPEFTGELRIMAVAANHTQVGSAQASVKIKRPLVVEVALPRFLAPGDRCLGTVEIFNETGRDIQADIQVACAGSLAIENPKATAALKAGASQRLPIQIKAGDYPGRAQCTVQVEAGEEQYRETIELAIRPAADLATHEVIGRLRTGEQVDLEAPADWLEANLQSRLWCGPRPAARWGGALEALVTYPYGCLEQTISGAFPLLYLPEAAGLVATNVLAAHDGIRSVVNAAILRVLSMHTGNGGFSLWPGTPVYAWGSLYAGHFLVEARRAGYEIPDDRLAQLKRYARERLDAKGSVEVDPQNAAWQRDMEERAYACRVLALLGAPDAGWNARLLEQQALLGHGAAAHLAAALVTAGEPRAATEVLNRRGLPAADRTGVDPYTLRSPVRDAALQLAVWMEIAPDDPHVPPLVEFIELRMTNGQWNSTQENAAALTALARYAAWSARQAPQVYQAKMRERGQPTLAFDSQTIWRWQSENSAQPFRLLNEGPGDLYYRASFEGVPATDRLPEDNVGVMVWREWYDLQGHPITNLVLARGELIVVRLVLKPLNENLDNLVLCDLLPAGLEIENPALATAQRPPWISEPKSEWLRKEARDDRVLLFTGPVRRQVDYYYSARAVTPGQYVYPAAAVAGMYEPSIWSRHGRATLRVEE